MENNLLEKITAIKELCKFKKDYNLHDVITYGLNDRFALYLARIKDVKSRKETRIKLKKIGDKLSEAVKLIDNELIHFNYIQQLKDALLKEVKEIHKTSQRKPSPKISLKNFLIRNLLLIYLEGTGKPVKCGWCDDKAKASGDTFIFFSEIRKILPLINKKFILGTDGSICTSINKIKAELRLIQKGLDE